MAGLESASLQNVIEYVPLKAGFNEQLRGLNEVARRFILRCALAGYIKVREAGNDPRAFGLEDRRQIELKADYAVGTHNRVLKPYPGAARNRVAPGL